MLKIKKFISNFKIFFLMIFTALGLTTCASNSKIQKSPFDEPFDLSQVGKITEWDVEIKDKTNYSLNLKIYHRRPNKYSHYLDKIETREEDDNLRKIIGASEWIGPGQWIEPGIPATFHVLVLKKSNKEELVNSVVNNLAPSPSYMGYWIELSRVRLEPGLYTIRVKYIAGDAKLADFPADFIFAKAYHGK